MLSKDINVLLFEIEMHWQSLQPVYSILLTFIIFMSDAKVILLLASFANNTSCYFIFYNAFAISKA